MLYWWGVTGVCALRNQIFDFEWQKQAGPKKQAQRRFDHRLDVVTIVSLLRRRVETVGRQESMRLLFFGGLFFYADDSCVYVLASCCLFAVDCDGHAQIQLPRLRIIRVRGPRRPTNRRAEEP